jgi:hypothetical protein
MADVQQNTLDLLTPGSYVSRDHLTLQVGVPLYPEDLPAEQRKREAAIETRKLSIPIHHLENAKATPEQVLKYLMIRRRRTSAPEGSSMAVQRPSLRKTTQ